MTTFHADFRAMCAQMDAKRPEPQPVREPLPADTGTYAVFVSTCTLCGDESPTFTCKRCNEYLTTTGGKL
jgi:hypothetical protein